MGLIAAAVVAIGGIPGSAEAHSWALFGQRDLIVGSCCNGESLYGTKASIYTPPFPEIFYFPSPHCAVARSAAEADGTMIQTGWVRCAPGADLGGTCSLSNNLVKYVEWATPAVDFPQCIPKGGIGYGVETLFTVKHETDNGGEWHAWIAGVRDGTAVPMGDAQWLIEGIEWTHGTCDSFHFSGEFAIGIPWQRFRRPQGDWYQVQSSFKHLDCGYTDFGGPPYDFAFYH